MKIQRVRFNGAVHIGRAYEPKSTLAVGDQMELKTIDLRKYDDVFLEVIFRAKDPGSTYSQLVPWHRVDAAFIED